MEVLHLEKISYGTETQFKTTFKAFSVNEWLLINTDGQTMSGIATLPSAKHAAALATFLKQVEFKPPIAVLPLDKPSVACEEVSPLPFNLLCKRVLADMAKWGSNTEPKLDGTVPNPSKQLTEDIIAFRTATIAEREKSALSVKERVKTLLQLDHGLEDLMRAYPPWQPSWDSFVAAHQKPAAEPSCQVDILFNDGSVQDFDVRQREKQLELSISEAQRPALPTPRELVEEYFGEIQEDLVKLIEDKMPDADALRHALQELLQEETDEFVQKLVGC